MPLFFILSGYFFRSGKYGFAEFLKKKTLSLLVPYVFFMLVTWIGFKVINHPVYMPAYSLTDFLIYGPGSDPIWFLITLFFVEVLYFVLDMHIISKTKNPQIAKFVVCLLSFIGSLVIKYQFIGSLPYNIQNIPFYLFFYTIGVLRLVDIQEKMVLWVLMLLLVLNILAEHNMPYGIAQSDVLYLCVAGYFIALWGAFLLMNFSYKLSILKNPCLQIIKNIICFFGKYSIVVLGLHTVIVRSVRCAFEPLGLPNTISFPIRQLVLWIILALAIFMLNRWTPILIGKKR